METENSSQLKKYIKNIFGIVFILICSWLFMCAWVIEGEYGDGYATIVNSRFLFSDSPLYYAYRGPIAAIVLWPVEMLVQYFQIHPLNVKPYHLYSAFLHSFYLLGCWYILRRMFGENLAVLLAFFSAILSVVFIAYAPYLSHDIIPGLLFLIMIFAVKKWLLYQTWQWALFIVLLGAVVTLIKQTFAIFWFSLIIYAITVLLIGRNSELISRKKCAILFFLASVSALISWLGYGFFIQSEYPDESLWLRPIKVIEHVATLYDNDPNYNGSLQHIFPWTIYLYNLPNYGIAAMVLILPSLYFSLRGRDDILFMIAICWVVSFIIIIFIGVREVRYLAFLAPLTAVLLVPTIERIIQLKPPLYVGLLAIVLLDISRSITLASAYVSNAEGFPVQKFLAPVDKLLDSNKRLFFSQPLTFPFLLKSPLIKDRYHGLYHLASNNFDGLYQGKIKVSAKILEMKPGDLLLFSKLLLVRSPPWQRDNLPHHLDDFLQFLGEAELIKLKKKDEYFQVYSPNKGAFLIINSAKNNSYINMGIIQDRVSMKEAYQYFGSLSKEHEIEVLAVHIANWCTSSGCIYSNY